jgi:hypothetical protein
MANAAAPTSPSEDQDTNSPTWGVVVVHGVGLLEPGATLETFVLALADHGYRQIGPTEVRQLRDQPGPVFQTKTATGPEHPVVKQALDLAREDHDIGKAPPLDQTFPMVSAHDCHC